MKYFKYLCSSKAGKVQLVCFVGFVVAILVNLIVGIYAPTHYSPRIDNIAKLVILFDWIWIGWPSMIFAFVTENSFDLYARYLAAQR
jgi:purine-cytosine permease-like protein